MLLAQVVMEDAQLAVPEVVKVDVKDLAMDAMVDVQQAVKDVIAV